MKELIILFCLASCAGSAFARDIDPPEEIAKRKVIESQIEDLYETFGAGNIMPEIYKLLEENIEERLYVETLVYKFRGNAEDPIAEGDPEVYKMMRKVIDVYGNNPPWGAMDALSYLRRKGNASDLERLPNDAVLMARVAGTNILHVMEGTKLLPSGRVGIVLDFIPSVTNVGPQSLYVREILQRYWKEVTEVPDDFTIETISLYVKQARQDLSKMPTELLTIAISFDEKGSPVSSVDLAEYGLSMPIITPKPDKHYQGEYTIIFPHELTSSQYTNATEIIIDQPHQTNAPSADALDSSIDTSFEQQETPVKKSKPYWVGILVLAIIGGIVACALAWRKRHGAKQSA